MDIYCKETLRAKFTNTRIICGFVIVSLTLIYSLFWKPLAHSSTRNRTSAVMVDSYIYKTHSRMSKPAEIQTESSKAFRYVHWCTFFSSYFPPVHDIKIYVLFTEVALLAWCSSGGQVAQQFRWCKPNTTLLHDGNVSQKTLNSQFSSYKTAFWCLCTIRLDEFIGKWWEGCVC